MDPPAAFIGSGRESVTVAEFPCHPGEVYNIGLWVAAAGPLPLQFRTLDADGKVLATRSAGIPLYRNLPAWTRVETRLSQRELGNARRVEVVAGAQGNGGALWLTGLSVRPSEDLRELPPGADFLGWIPGSCSALACSADGGFLALATARGEVTVMDALTGAAAEVRRQGRDQGRDQGREAMSPLDAVGSSTGAASRIAREPLSALAMGGGRIVGMDTFSRVWVMDLERDGGVARPFGTVMTPERAVANLLLEISPDGEWMVWGNQNEIVEIIKLEKDRLGKRVRLPLADDAWFTVNRRDNTIIAWDKSPRVFVIPFAELSGLDPAALVSQADFPAPVCAYKIREQAPVQGVVWRLPQFGLAALGANAGYRPLAATQGVIHLPAGPGAVAAAPDGTLFFAMDGGMVYKITPENLPKE